MVLVHVEAVSGNEVIFEPSMATRYNTINVSNPYHQRGT